MWTPLQFPWHLAQARKRLLDPIAEYWKTFRETWLAVHR